VALALLEKGHESKLFLSADSCGTIDWFPPEVVGEMHNAGLAIDWDVRIVHDRVIPTLREGGMADDQLETMMVRNPVAWLTGE
jgi:phosphotriesterase-related protein